MRYLLFFSILVSCSSTKLVPQSMEVSNQYIDEIKAPDKNEAEITNQLMSLQKISDEAYKIGAGDKFVFSVYDEDDLAEKGVLVKPDGTITLKLIGDVKIVGLTADSAARVIEARYRKYIKYPKVTLMSTELRSANFTIIGKVGKPGTYSINRGMRLTDAIATAQGLATGIFQNNTVEMADLEHSYLIRNGEIIPTEFVKAIREGNLLHNVLLKDGDYIYIPSSMNKEVFVVGEVESPGYIGFKESLSLIQAMAYAKGRKKTSSSQVVIVRGSLNHPRVFSMNIDEILKGSVRDFLLQPNDVVYFPKTVLASWNDIVTQLIPTLTATAIGKSLIE